MSIADVSLNTIDLFAGLSRDDLVDIEIRCRWHRYSADEPVFDKDSESLEVYFVVSGSVHILGQVGEREVALADIGQGRYFGELAALDGRPRSARAVASADTVLAALDGPAFVEVLTRHPQLAIRLMGRLSSVIRDLDARVIALSTTSESERICSELLRLAKAEPGNPDQWRVPDLPNHKDIAAWVGTSREVVAQVIGELARDGVVKRRGMGLAIVDMPRLRLLARAA